MKESNLKNFFKERKWLVPPGLQKKLKEYEKLCDLFIKMKFDGIKEKPILIHGPSGVGKSLFVDFFISKFSQLRENEFPIQQINCAAYPETLIDSELFGYEKGAFTGANKYKKGAFENSENGILVLEEIGELPTHIQAKLLLVLENKEFFPLGSSKAKQATGMVIATTNKCFDDFRIDLWSRFRKFHIPPLHKRRIDILFYLAWFLTPHEKTYKLTPPEILYLLSYNWPGNVREIEHIVEDLIIYKDITCVNLGEVEEKFKERLNDSEIPEDLDGCNSIEEWKQMNRINFNDTKGYIKDHIKKGNLFGENPINPLLGLQENFSSFNPMVVNSFYNKIEKIGVDIRKLNSILYQFHLEIMPFHPLGDILDEFNAISYQHITKDHPYYFIDLSLDGWFKKDLLEKKSKKDLFIFTNKNTRNVHGIFQGFCLFCYLFFQDFQADHNILDLKAFQPISEWNLELALNNIVSTTDDLSHITQKLRDKGLEINIKNIRKEKQSFDIEKKSNLKSLIKELRSEILDFFSNTDVVNAKNIHKAKQSNFNSLIKELRSELLIFLSNTDIDKNKILTDKNIGNQCITKNFKIEPNNTSLKDLPCQPIKKNDEAIDIDKILDNKISECTEDQWLKTYHERLNEIYQGYQKGMAKHASLNKTTMHRRLKEYGLLPNKKK